MTHKILETIGDSPITTIEFLNIKHSPAVTNEAFSVLATFNKSSTDFKSLKFNSWSKLEDKLSPTVLD